MLRAVRTAALAALALAVLPAVACGGGGPVAFDEIEVPDLPRPVGDQTCPEALSSTPEGPPSAPTAAAPYPTPAGEKVTPGITGIPAPPNTEQVDSFRRRWDGHDAVVQVFVTDAAIQDVFSFYGEVFAEQRWVRLSQSQSPLGATCEYASVGRVGNLSGPEHWIVVASTYIARDGEENGDPPPGFRANGISYAPRGTDKTYFSIITPKP